MRVDELRQGPPHLPLRLGEWRPVAEAKAGRSSLGSHDARQAAVGRPDPTAAAPDWLPRPFRARGPEHGRSVLAGRE